MDLRQLHSFLAVIDHGSFSAAAAALFTVQSNVSAHVGRLEAELEVTLLDRRTRELTPAGQVVERRSREIMRLVTAITDDLAALEDRIIGEVVCGVTPSIGLRIIPPTLTVAGRELPEVSLSVMEAHSGALVQQLLSGDLDLAITTGAANPELSSIPLFDEDIVAILAPDHPLADRASVSLADLSQAPLLLPLHDNPLYRHIAQTFELAGLPMHIELEIGSSALVQALASASVGIALIPATAAADGERQVVVKPIAGMAPRGVALTTRRSTQPSRAVAAIGALVERVARTAANSMPGCRPVEPEASQIDLDVVSITNA